MGQDAKPGSLLAHTTGKGRDDEGDKDVELASRVPSRAQQLSRMVGSTREKPFDLLIIGGGATGAGCALDACTRCDDRQG